MSLSICLLFEAGQEAVPMRLSVDASPGDIIQGLALGHAGFDVALKNNKSPLILSFPRRRESMLTFIGQLSFPLARE